ncbi:MAG: PD-(D/E)XK nuclease family protein [Planctomycetaceae bacterium]|jgi:hypothetical protein|nr:PD-(D/E)XK nuclease family protein [Planctomycetaceae bacterium]
MSEKPLTYEGVLEMFRETREQMQETNRQIQETWRIAREAHRKISSLGSRIGEIVENMVGGDKVIDLFQALGYEISQYHRNTSFGRELGLRGEIDLFLENGNVAILIEVKTTLRTADVREHMERLEKYRRCADARGDKRRFIGAVAGAVVEGEAEEFAHQNGLYVIVQSGESVEIIPVPEGFQAKEW